MTNTDTAFNLHATACTVITDGTSADPRDLAKELVAQIPDADRDAAMEHMAAGYVRNIIGSMRASARNNATPAKERKHATASKRVAAAREQWQRMLDVPEFIKSTGQWVRLAVATRDEVLEMAESRAAKARENTAAADRYKKLAAAMADNKAATVSDLPSHILVAVMTTGAES